MPLQDHFSPPLSTRRHWHAFHNAWATYIAAALNQDLPPGFFAEPNVQYGIEIDVGTFEEYDGPRLPGWSPPGPALSVPMTVLTDVVEVQVFSSQEGPVLAGAIELVSPSNKDRPTSRSAFAGKCASLLQGGVGLLVVDVVTHLSANLHLEVMRRVAAGNEGSLDARLYAAAYRPRTKDTATLLDVWFEPLNLGAVLPTLPLCLRRGPTLPLDLERTYVRTCQEQRIG